MLLLYDVGVLHTFEMKMNPVVIWLKLFTLSQNTSPLDNEPSKT